MRHHYIFSQKLTLVLLVFVMSLSSETAIATSVDSAAFNTQMMPPSTSLGKQRYLSAEVSAAPSTVTNRSGSSGYGRSGNFTCPNISSQGATTANIMTGMREIYAATATPAISASNRRAFVIGNFRYDPYCSSASSFTGQCTGYRYARTYVRLDEIRITCGTINKLPYYNFNINTPSAVTGISFPPGANSGI